MDINSPIPSYLTGKTTIIRLTVFTAIFALIFINVYSPFGVDVWFHVTQLQLFFYSSLVILTGILVIVLSRVLLHFASKKNKISYIGYAFWILAEIFFMALFYAIYVKMILHDNRDFIQLLKVSTQNTALVLLLPYSLMWLYLRSNDQKLKLQNLESAAESDPARLMIPFHDERGVMRMSIKLENLLYIEAADNYVVIHYLNGDKRTKYMLRNNLKSIEEKYKGTDLVRCHRSYMINCSNVKLIRRSTEGIMLELDADQNITVPVSKMYAENVLKTFSHLAPL